MAFGQDANDIDDNDLVDILNEADLNNDGNINIDDFFKLMYDDEETSTDHKD